MLDFTNTPARRRKAAQARQRRLMIWMGMAILIPVAASALDLQALMRLASG